MENKKNTHKAILITIDQSKVNMKHHWGVLKRFKKFITQNYIFVEQQQNFFSGWLRQDEDLDLFRKSLAKLMPKGANIRILEVPVQSWCAEDNVLVYS